MSNRASGAIGIRILAFTLAAVAAAGLWLVAASALWSKGTGTPFTPFAWWDATQWWLANWWVNLWLVLAAAVPTVFLTMLLFGLFQIWRLRYRGRRRLTARPGGAVRPVERGITDNHGHSQWRSLGDAKKLFPGPDPIYGGIVVGEAYRVDHDQTVAGIPFGPADKRSWGMGGKAPLLIDPCTHGSGHSLVFAGPGGFKTTAAVSTVLTWTGSSVILDPSTELGPMLDAALRRQRKRVVHIGIPTTRAANRASPVSTSSPGSTSRTLKPNYMSAASCRGFTMKRRQRRRRLAGPRIPSSPRWAARSSPVCLRIWSGPIPRRST